jgi:hypothetical protein
MVRVQVLEAVRIASLELDVDPCRACDLPDPLEQAVSAAVFDEHPALPFWPAESEPLPARWPERPNPHRARRAIDAYSRTMNQR